MTALDTRDDAPLQAERRAAGLADVVTPVDELAEPA
jgi:hypothetical protein